MKTPKFKPLLNSVACGAALLLAGGAQAGVVTNGGFETQTGSSLSGFCYTSSAGCTLAGWDTNGGTVVIGANSGAWGGPSSLANGQAGLGSFVLGLQGTGATLSQYLTLDAGAQVALSWFDAGRSNHSGLQGYEVTFAGAELGTFSTQAGQAWGQHNLSFTANGSGVLAFRSLNVGSYDRTSFINGIDAVASVSQVPEPQSLALALTGLATLALLRRRSRRS
ncbi:MAG: PEP-CTERM sorting domain-containing protein [Paucibacter sp.]|nr:PEP-CTERM sorting domain-containing protein [Roseateles sp.]